VNLIRFRRQEVQYSRVEAKLSDVLVAKVDINLLLCNRVDTTLVVGIPDAACAIGVKLKNSTRHKRRRENDCDLKGLHVAEGRVQREVACLERDCVGPTCQGKRQPNDLTNVLRRPVEITREQQTIQHEHIISFDFQMEVVKGA
jgi:hypothetical protein